MKVVRRSLIVSVLTVALVLLGTAAYALVTRSGSSTDQQRFVHDDLPFATGAAAFVPVPTSLTSITITSPHLFDARFTAESRCLGPIGWCSVRIVLFTPSGAMIELDPVSGIDFAFDTAEADYGEGHAIERTSPVMPAGTYRFMVQTGVVAGATTVVLDDWTFAIEAVNP